MNIMINQKVRNILVSLIILAFWASAILFLSSKNASDPGTISLLYVWAKVTSILASCTAGIFFVLRLMRLVHQQRNFVYSFLAVTNTLLGVAGVVFFLMHKINIIGLHDLLLNLLIGIILLADIFFFS